VVRRIPGGARAHEEGDEEDDMNSVAGPRAVFGTKKKDYSGVQARGSAMANAFTTNAAMFGTLPITLVAFTALLAAFVLAQAVVTETKAKGSATLRNTKGNALWSAMQVLQKCVQNLADALPADAAASLIESAGLLVAKIGTHQKAALTAALTVTQGTVLLDASRKLLVGPGDAAKKTLFNWQWSPDGGKTWNSATPTPLASTEIPGLTPLSTYSFRVSVTVSKVTGPWSQAVSLLVH
jgi:hypothetical protein